MQSYTILYVRLNFIGTSYRKKKNEKLQTRLEKLHKSLALQNNVLKLQ